ncbi:MAG: alpha/beta hydrolase [Planctomycetota bacterium]
MNLVVVTLLAALAAPSEEEKLLERVSHKYAKNGDVKIHYVEVGKGPLVVMIHGFPDYWYSWRKQMLALEGSYRVAALDLRGYNRSDQPKGIENYDMKHLVNDVASVIEHAGEKKAIVVGHDWGGMVAWSFAMRKPAMTERLVVLNLPHPRGLIRELVSNPQQRKNSQYARNFQKEGAHKALKASSLAFWVKDNKARVHYVNAFKRSSVESMLAYYKQNYPKEPYDKVPVPKEKVKAPVLVIHGLKDPYLLAPALNGTWDWVEKDLSIVTVPKAGHFVQHDAPDFVNQTLKAWLSLER